MRPTFDQMLEDIRAAMNEWMRGDRQKARLLLRRIEEMAKAIRMDKNKSQEPK